MNPADVRILDGSTFVVSDVTGDISASRGQALGMFYRDMRHLSTWQLLLDGRSLEALSARAIGYNAAVFFLVLPTGTIYRNPTLSAVRRRYVGEGLREQLTLHNHSTEPVRVELSMLFGSDFADLFEVKDAQSKTGDHYRRIEGSTMVLGYRRDDFVRETHITAEGAFVTEGALAYQLDLEPGAAWETGIEVAMSHDGDLVPVGSRRRKRPEQPRDEGESKDLGEWVADAPRLESGWDPLYHTYRRSIEDLAALRFYPDVVDGGASLPAAGLPWFMALFGRDSLITSYQALPFAPELATTTLRTLAARQAADWDDFRDAEPGKILHELRFGELTHFHKWPQSPYYGSADSTPLFLILLDEYERWTGDAGLVRELERPARAALRWLEEFGDLDGDGYIEYQPRNTTSGLLNQCWKDSWNSIVHPDGSLASLPRGTCELQGYAYDARLRLARVAREIWHDDELARRLERDAAELRRRFNADFWVKETDFFALALDGDKHQVRTVTSNVGHLLWSGIVDEEKVAPVVRRLMGEELFSGWGVRTLASGQAVFNPIEYHNGTVWPHDNAIIAAGLARYGRHEEAGRIAVAMMEAAGTFDYRLPEVFAGYAREETGFPVPYPTACSPQAWAAGTPLLLLRVVLGLEPGPREVRAEPHVPERFGDLRVTGIRGPGGRSDVG